MLTTTRIVLVRPRDPNNIGAAARAMKNFGLTDLAVVSPWAPVWREAVSAVNAADVLAGARLFDSLAEAIADCTLVVGTTDQTRLTDSQPLYTPTDLRHELTDTRHRLALVFGSEKHGLTGDDLSHCHRTLSIPTQPDCPSMNLGQAVAICCYELGRDDQPVDQTTLTPEPATAAELEAGLQLMMDVLGRSGFLLPGNERARRLKLRRSLHRLGLTKQEAGFLCGALRQIISRL